VNLKQTKAERTRNFIVEATASIFNTKGYAGTSLSDLTEATGLTKGSIYGNFSSKEEVALAAFDYNYNKVRRYVKEKIDQEETYLDKLLVYSVVYKNFLRSPFPPGGCALLNTAVEADDTHPLLKERVARALIRWRKSLVDLVEQGIEEGEFDPGTDANRVAISIMALIEGGIMIAKATNTTSYMHTVLKSVELLVMGITKK
jgi:AcrR family transcriptional regulator